MKKTKILILLLYLVPIISGPSIAIDKETLWSKLSFTPESKETETIALQNLSLVEEILFLSDFQRDNDSAKVNSLQILEMGVWSGRLTREKYFEIILRFLNQIPSLVHSEDVPDTKNIAMATLASYGRQETLKSNFSGFPLLTNAMLASGQIKNSGLLNSLTQKVSNAKEILDKRGSDAKNTATNKIQATINELDAQKGKGITADGCEILSGYCKNLITKIQTTN